ncbi:hypothetical protein Bpfe_021864, partial [Biomphalaria pfeifferi]
SLRLPDFKSQRDLDLLTPRDEGSQIKVGMKRVGPLPQMCIPADVVYQQTVYTSRRCIPADFVYQQTLYHCMSRVDRDRKA